MHYRYRYNLVMSLFFTLYLGINSVKADTLANNTELLINDISVEAHHFCSQNGWKIKSYEHLVRKGKKIYYCILPNRQAVELNEFYEKRHSEYLDVINKYKTKEYEEIRYQKRRLAPADKKDTLKDDKKQYPLQPRIKIEKDFIRKIIEEIMLC